MNPCVSGKCRVMRLFSSVALFLVLSQIASFSEALAEGLAICESEPPDSLTIEEMVEGILNAGTQSAPGDTLYDDKIRVRILYATFPEVPYGPADTALTNLMEPQRADSIPVVLGRMITWQSRGSQDYEIQVCRRSDYPDSLWVMDFPSSYYASADSMEIYGSYPNCWLAGFSTWNQGMEFFAELMHKWDASAPGDSLLGDPGWRYVLVPNGLPWAAPSTTDTTAYIGGNYLKLYVTNLNCVGLYCPDSQNQLPVVKATWKPEWSDFRSPMQLIWHELGHSLGYEHLPDSKPDPSTPLAKRYFYGVQGSMRAIALNPDVPYGALPHHLYSLTQFRYSHFIFGLFLKAPSWYSWPKEVRSSAQGLVLRDIRLSSESMVEVVGDSILLGSGYLPDPDVDYEFWSRESFFISFHSRTNEDGQLIDYGAEEVPLYPSAGVAVWHGFVTTMHTFVPNTSVWLGSSNTLITADLESAWGRFADPSGEIQGQLADPYSGYDNHDDWSGRTGDPSEVELVDYRGSELDFFSASQGRSSTFSYQGNPNSYGIGPLASGDPNWFDRRAPQDVPSSLYIEVVEEGVDDEGPYAIVDILLAPHEDITFPNGGEALTVGDPVTIMWGDKRTWGWDYSQGNGYGTGSLKVVDSLDVYVDTGDSLYLVEADVANAGSYTWTPSADHVGDSVRVHLVFHNTLEPDKTGVDESDGTFSVYPRLTLAEKSSESGINVQGLQPYSAIAFAVDESDSLDNPRLDLLISRIGGTAQVYENVSVPKAMSEFAAPTFTVFETGSEPHDVRGLAAADIDNDGDVDFFAAAATNPRLYINQGPGSEPRFVDVADDNNLSSSAANSWGGTWADYDRDGWVDLYISRAGGTATPTGITPDIDRLFQSQGIVNGVVDFVDMSASAGLYGGQNSTLSAAWGDADADGDLDLFVGFLPVDTSTAGEHSLLYLSDNDGTFSQVALDNVITGGPGFPRMGYVSGAVWLDADRDGLMDLAISRQDPNPSSSTMPSNLEILRNLGGGEFDKSDDFDLDANITATLQGLSVGDLDLDGWPDLVAVPVSSGVAPLIMLNDMATDSGFVNQASQLGIGTGAAQGTVLADFNLDGDPDLYLGRSSDFFYQNVSSEYGGTILTDEPDAAWVQIRLISTTKGNNRMGIGARVTVYVEADSVVGFVDGGSGRGGQTPGILTFGLGAYTGSTVDVTVRWPDGYEQGPITANVGELETITDDHDPSLNDSLVGLVAVTRPGGLVDWEFHWYTDYSTDISQDYVEIVSESLTLYPGDTNVDHSVTPHGPGGYRHELSWRNQSCVPGTTVQYKVGSSVYGGSPEESSLKSTKIKVCVQ